MSNEGEFYTPAQTAEILGVSVWVLKSWRLKGYIEGRDIGNSTLYTMEQIRNVKRPRPKKPAGEGPRYKKNHPTQTDDALPVGVDTKVA